MGTDPLTKLASPPTEVHATTNQYNAVVDAFHGDVVARDVAGAVVDGAGDLGKPASGRFDKLHLKSGMTVDGKTIDFSSLQLAITGVNSGKAKSSGYPDFLQAGGSGNDYFSILAQTTHLEMTIDGQAYSLEADLQSSTLSLAPSTNNACAVNDGKLISDPVWTKTIGEFGYWITVDSVGSEITALDGTVQCFYVANGASSELFIAEIDLTNNRIVPLLRGICGNDRIAFSDNDVIVLLKAHYIFLDKNLATIDTTTNYPKWQTVAPTSPTTGDYWNKTSDGKWYRWSGAFWEMLGRIYLGYAVCDSVDCYWVEHVDFNLAWDGAYTLSENMVVSTSALMFLGGEIKINVAGTNIVARDATVSTADDLEPGEVWSDASENKYYYFYVDSFGVFWASTKCPRNKDQKKGYYHPREYWRCIGVVWVTSGPTLIQSSYSPNAGKGAFQYDYIGASSLSLTTTAQLFSVNVPPIVKSINALIKTTDNNNYHVEIDVYEGRVGTLLNHIITMRSANNLFFVPFSIINNGILKMRCTDAAIVITFDPIQYDLIL